MRLNILLGREIEELLNHRPTRSSVLILLPGWNNCIQIILAGVQEYLGLIRP